jgi:biotin transport system substrate-specific component
MTIISRPYIFMWTIVGLFLTIGANFIPVYVTSSPFQWLSDGVTAYPLGFKCQVGAVLLVSCLGGRTAGVLTQVAYLLLGLLWLKIFNDGGGIEYLQKPVFGYLLGFIPGAWVCGQLAFKRSPQLESLGLSCLCGLLTIHFFIRCDRQLFDLSMLESIITGMCSHIDRLCFATDYVLLNLLAVAIVVIINSPDLDPICYFELIGM